MDTLLKHKHTFFYAFLVDTNVYHTIPNFVFLGISLFFLDLEMLIVSFLSITFFVCLLAFVVFLSGRKHIIRSLHHSREKFEVSQKINLSTLKVMSASSTFFLPTYIITKELGPRAVALLL